MRIPKMILFDYGQTLVNEGKFDGIKGTEAVLRYATKNKYHKSAVQIQEAANAMNAELGRFDEKRQHLMQVEVPNNMFSAYLYASQGIELSIGADDIDRIFWDAAAPGRPTEGVEKFLLFLKQKGIRTGVISNIAYCGKVVEERIHACLPENAFEFMIASSEYMFRKPNKRIFELALEKAGLPPEDVWYIGDNYACDIVGAKNAGIFPVWYVGSVHTPEDVEEKMERGIKEEILVIREWDRLQKLMEKIEPVGIPEQ